MQMSFLTFKTSLQIQRNAFLTTKASNIQTCRKQKETDVWDISKRILLSYLSLSGQFLPAWAKENVYHAQRITTDNLQQTTNFQNALNIAAASAATLLENTSPKVEVGKGLLSLQSKVESLPVDITKRKGTISIIQPLPNLEATPGVQLVQTVNMEEYFQLSDPSSYLELSMKQSNGNPVPNWLSLGRTGFSEPMNVFLEGNAYSVFVVQPYAYVATVNFLKIVDLRKPTTQFTSNLNTSPQKYQNDRLFIMSNYAFYSHSTGIDILDISNPTQVLLKQTIPSVYQIQRTLLIGNFLYSFEDLAFTSNSCYLRAIDVTNPLQPIAQVPKLIDSTLSGPAMCACNNHLCITTQSSTGGSKCWIMDISQPANPTAVGSFITSTKVGDLIGQNNYLYIGSSQLEIYDLTQPSNPSLLSTAYQGIDVSSLLIEGNYLYFICSSSASFNVAPFVVVFNIENPSQPQVVDFSYGIRLIMGGAVQSNTVYLAETTVGLSILNDSERTFSGIPSSADRGLINIEVTATDGLGNSIINPIAVYVGDINVKPVADQQIYVSETVLFTLPPQTFDFPGAIFAYNAQLMDGLPLPSFISFDADTLTFIFTPQAGDQNIYQIEVTANDGYKNTTTFFGLTVLNNPPIVEHTLGDQTALSGVPFQYAFSNSFFDLDGDLLTYTAYLQGSTSLPSWLSFDASNRQFYGTPFQKGVFPIQVTANDGHGGTVTNQFTITVPNSAPMLLNPLGTSITTIDIPFSFTFSSNTFYDVDGDPLTYSVGQLPSFISFNPSTRTFTGTPHLPDLGTYQIMLQADDGNGGIISTSFSLTVMGTKNDPPILIISIPDMTQNAGIPFDYIFDARTFVDPEGARLTYEATLEGGAPLPDGLYFDSDTRMLSGMLQDSQSLKISIKAIDPMGAFAIDSFTLNILDHKNYPPIVLNALPSSIAVVGQPFLYPIPHDTFADRNNETLILSASLSMGKPLPKWLKWDSANNNLRGTPTEWDTDTFQDKVLDVEIWATDLTGSVKTTFEIIVKGESFWEIFLKVGLSLSSFAISGIGYWKSRALLWNHFYKHKYQKCPETALIGNLFSRNILEFNKRGKVCVYHRGQLLSQLPNGLTVKDSQIYGTPEAQKTDRFTICIFDTSGYIYEQFDLIIKKVNELDPPEEKSNRSLTLPSLRRKTVTTQNPMTEHLLGEEV